ncbi:helix-turn-helix domain-containing protein [Fulvivirga sp.]|uniref:winged helix-turn-helix transcriptional regulator n=1 Tax=Fulvivirga sp. TaxID=1931237 RepID=UPI0032ED212C
MSESMIIDGKKYKYRLLNQEFHCALDVTMHYIGGKWKAVVLWYLRKEKKRFSELKLLIPDITDKMLSLQLKALEEDGIIKRTLYSEVPPRVEYEFTEEGKSLIPVVEAIAQWGKVKANTEGKLVEVEEGS